MANKTSLVDPNEFFGNNSSNNFFVPYEDLTILVELSATKKGRTLLTTNKEKIGTSESTDTVVVKFIEGSDVNGKKVLTTKFTDLTTTFDNNQGENLGITAIDIDFNSSYAPLITIQFVDVRGSAIFQNEAKTANNKNKYSIFFQLPYPLYKLKIKGYYGQPVEYCLHMTKFNSRFNSQTGNFEITANFIGYTYAMLSDMLIGYLKVIEYTELGAAKYRELKQLDPTLLTLDDLRIKIDQINLRLEKLLSTDDGYSQISNADNRKSQLRDIRNKIISMSENVDIRKISNSYEFVIGDVNNRIKNQQYIQIYIDEVTKLITEYNDNNQFKLDINDFTNVVDKSTYQDISINILNDPIQAEIPLNNASNIEDTRQAILKYVNKNGGYGISNTQLFDIIDNRNRFKKIDDATGKIDAEVELLKKQLAERLKNKFSEDIGFAPTIRNIINIFTTSVEVFLYCLHTVSRSADDIANTDRRDELKKAFGENQDKSDIIISTTNNTPSNSASGSLDSKYYPWPDYRKSDDVNGLVEAYLGENGVLENPNNVDELVFINDLFEAFIKQALRAEDIDKLTEGLGKNWASINPLDTKIYNQEPAYQRIEANTKKDLINYILLRAIIFLGVTNRSLTEDEIRAMATVEAEAIVTDLLNQKDVLQSLTQATFDEFINANGDLNGRNVKLLTENFTFNSAAVSPNNETYEYNYIFDTEVLKILPINNSFNGIWPLTNLELIEKSEDTLFLTNYVRTETLDVNNNLIIKDNDGGIYIKILTPDEYRNINSTYPLPSNIKTESNISLSKLKLSNSDFPNRGEGVGFNIFGGPYGIQEFTSLIYDDTNVDLTGLPFRYMFYANASPAENSYNKSNGLGLKRLVSNTDDQSKPTTSVFDIKPNNYQICDTIGDITQMIDTDIQFNKSNILHKNYGKNRSLSKQYLIDGNQNITYPYINFYVGRTANSLPELYDNMIPVSLFGSRLYNEQVTDEAKAFLFLHTFPWKGLVRDSNSLLRQTVNETIFYKNEIINTFGQRSGFVSVPKLWAAFIGGLLWRYDSQTEPILFHNGVESFIPTLGNTTATNRYPQQNQYLSFGQDPTQSNLSDAIAIYVGAPMCFIDNTTIGFDYKNIDELLLTLPEQAKTEFKKIFLSFVSVENGTSDWEVIKKQLELQTTNGWTQTYNFVTNPNNSVLTNINGINFLNTQQMSNTYGSNFNNYAVFTPVIGGVGANDYKYNYFLEIKDESPVIKSLLDLFNKELIIANMNYRIWLESNYNNLVSGVQPIDFRKNKRGIIDFRKVDIELYINTILEYFRGKVYSAEDKRKEIESALFGTTDENIIKLMLYRTCKNLYDKWIAETNSPDEIMFQCGSRNTVDSELARKRTSGNSTTPALIDSFRFVSRSFEDIGDKLAINPIPISDYLRNNPNSSFYDVVTSILSSNNLDFVPLPSFINYRDPELLKSIFKPIPTYSNSVIHSVAGPSFVCVYVGQKSKHLDFNDSQYTNDGFDVVKDTDGNVLGLPDDFVRELNDDEDPVTFFDVKFGQQNQNIFKEIALDQSEFAETAESLQIIDDISNKGMETNRTLAGQNIFNVYSVRSYKVEVEMMGNAMIQPMMYFNLSNIPMFHGAYMITRVKHSIKPNNMSTQFTGVRIRKPKSPIFEIADLYMSLIDTIDTANVRSVAPTSTFGTLSLRGSYPPIISTIIENGGVNGNIIAGDITMTKFNAPKGIYNGVANDQQKNRLLTEAANTLNTMLIDWVNWMKSQGFKGNNGNYAGITSLFRSIEQQEQLYEDNNCKEKKKQNKSCLAATPGTSRHGWGIAVDFQFYKKNGQIINNNQQSISIGFDFNINESIVWLLDNSYTYGWIIPEGLRNDTGTEEFWHFEYHGLSAACLLSKRPKIKGRVIDVTKPYKEGVQNPKLNGVDAIYNNCDYVNVDNNLDGTEDIILPENKNIIVIQPSVADVNFYTDILTQLGAQPTSENLKFLYAWRQAEGAKAAWNPFNTTQSTNNATAYSCTKSGKAYVKNYSNRNDGLNATTKTLLNGYYPNIVQGLKNNIGAYQLSLLLDDLTKWGTKKGINRVLAGETLNPPSIAQTITVQKMCS